MLRRFLAIFAFVSWSSCALSQSIIGGGVYGDMKLNNGGAANVLLANPGSALLANPGVKLLVQAPSSTNILLADPGSALLANTGVKFLAQ